MRLNDLGPLIRVYGDVDFRGNCPAETDEQITFFNKLRREYPDTFGAVALHPRNEQQLRKGQHQSFARQKAEGMTTGASDIIIPARVTFVCELKRQDRTKSKWQDGQREYLESAACLGAFACVALGWSAAWRAMEDWNDLF